MRFKKTYIEITNICNKNCSFCSVDKRNKKEMTIEEFEHILKEIKPYTNYIYLHVKGEPLLHSNFSKIISIAEQYSFNVNITTNGTLLVKQKDILKNKCIRQINISLHSFEKKEEPNYFSNIFEVTKELLNNNSKLSIVYRFWALKNNNLSVTNKEIIDLIIKEYNLNNDFYNLINIKNNVKIKEQLYLNKGDIFEWPNIENDYVSDNGTCQGTRLHIGILSDGTVIPCCLDSNKIINLGNIFTQSMESILKCKRFVEINENFKNNKIIEELCKHCSYRKRFNTK